MYEGRRGRNIGKNEELLPKRHPLTQKNLLKHYEHGDLKILNSLKLFNSIKHPGGNILELQEVKVGTTAEGCTSTKH